MASLSALKRDELRRAFKTLEESLSRTDIERSFQRDSALLRFEFVSELAAKTLRLVLSERFAVDAFVPVEIYRQARKAGIFTDEQTEVFIRITRDRNRMVHDYSETFADELYARIASEYAAAFRQLLDIIDDAIPL